MSSFQVYRDKKGEWRWRLVDNEDHILAVSGEGYHNRQDCIHGLLLVRKLSPVAERKETES